MIESLKADIYMFSTAKNYQLLKTLKLALVDADGNIIAFDEFKRLALEINNQYNVNWLQAEYQTVIGTAQMASKWVDFDDDATLEFVTVGDDKVRPSHAMLDGIKCKKKDSFWLKYYPPLWYRCRCNVLETLDDETPESDIETPPASETFGVNLAHEGKAFPKDHPYYKGVPKEAYTEYSKQKQA